MAAAAVAHWWEDHTVALSDAYAHLQVVTSGGHVEPVVPLAASETDLLVAVPAEVLPWLPTTLVPLAE